MLFAKAEKVQMSGYAGRDGRRWRDGWESGWSRGFRRYIVFGIKRGPNNKSDLRSYRSFHQNLFQTQFMFKRSRNEDDTNGPGRGKYKRTKKSKKKSKSEEISETSGNQTSQNIKTENGFEEQTPSNYENSTNFQNQIDPNQLDPNTSQNQQNLQTQQIQNQQLQNQHLQNQQQQQQQLQTEQQIQHQHLQNQELQNQQIQSQQLQNAQITDSNLQIKQEHGVVSTQQQGVMAALQHSANNQVPSGAAQYQYQVTELNQLQNMNQAGQNSDIQGQVSQEGLQNMSNIQDMQSIQNLQIMQNLQVGSQKSHK